MKRREKDIKAIEKALSYISNAISIRYDGEMVFPDEIIRNEEACDVITELGTQKLAIEHTTIDSIPDQRKDDSHFLRLLGPLEKELEYKLPFPGRYQLAIGSNVIPTGKNIKWEEIRAAIKEWCIKVAPSLKIASGGRGATGHYITVQPTGVPFEVSLYRRMALGKYLRDGKITIMRFVPKKMESKRERAVLEILRKRAPKLYKYRNKGYRTVLILELEDFALSSMFDIGRAFGKIMKRELSLKFPDEVYVVETIESPQFVECLKFDNTVFPSAVMSCSPYMQK